MITRLLLAAFLLGHAGIHAAFLSPRPPATAGGPAWPFELGRSRILDSLGIGREVGRMIGIAMVAVSLAAFSLAALIALGVGPAALWPVAIGLGAIGSLGVLVMFFDPKLVLGVAIDLGILWTVFVLGWHPGSLTD